MLALLAAICIGFVGVCHSKTGECIIAFSKFYSMQMCHQCLESVQIGTDIMMGNTALRQIYDFPQ